MAGAREAYNRAPMSAAHAELLGLAPESCVRGAFRPAGSKSLAQRALLAAAVARGTTQLAGLGEGEDVDAAVALVAALAPRCTREDGVVRVEGLAPARAAGLAPRAPVAVGESGTLARLSTALLALASRPLECWTVEARGSLLFRKSPPLFQALRAAGVELVRQNLPGTWPVEFVSIVPPGELELVRAVSSQEVSGLLLALAAHPEERVLRVRGRIPSEPYVGLSLSLLARFGARCAVEARGDERVYRVQGPLSAPAQPLTVEPDASSAAVALAAACLSGGELCVPGIGRGSAQGDARIVEHLCAFGCEARAEADALTARGFPVRGAELDLEGEPDLAPVLCAIAAGAALRAGATSELRGLATLPGKESDRLTVLAEGLRGVGLAVEVGVDTLRLAPGAGASAAPVWLDPRGDHRMAFAFALLGLLRPAVHVRDAGCVAKSWASFWSDLEGLGARLLEP